MLKEKQDYLREKFTFDPDSSGIGFNYTDHSDITLFDLSLVEDFDPIKLGAFKNNIPLYTIHDCFATTPNNMGLIKNNVTNIFSDMYFSTPYI